MRPLLLSLALFATSAATIAQPMPALSADAAAQALARGAVVVDVRAPATYRAGHLPGAVAVDADAAITSREALQAVVSRQGIDLSREVVVVGEPGDLRAQRLQQQLAAHASGRVGWLVGGTHEWVLTGRALHSGGATRAPVPQHLVRFSPVASETPDATRTAASASLRDLPATGPTLRLAADTRF